MIDPTVPPTLKVKQRHVLGGPPGAGIDRVDEVVEVAP